MVILVMNMVVITTGLVKQILLRAKRRNQLKALLKKIEMREIAISQQVKIEGSELPANLKKIKCVTPRSVNGA
jgi:hypothetical protein